MEQSEVLVAWAVAEADRRRRRLARHPGSGRPEASGSPRRAAAPSHGSWPANLTSSTPRSGRVPNDESAPATRRHLPGADFAVEVVAAGTRASIRLVGELDCYTAPRLDEALVKVIENGGTDVVVDLAGLSFLDLSGVRALARAGARLRAAGGRRPRAAQGGVSKLLAMVGLDGWQRG